MAFDIGPRIGIAGEKEFNNAIRNINTTMRELGSEMKLVTSEFDGNQNSMDALRAKGEVLAKQQQAHRNALALLNDQYDKQKKELSGLADALEKAKTEYGENSTEAIKASQTYNKQETTLSRLRAQINGTQTQINKLDSEIQTNTKHFKEAEESTDKTAKSIDEFGKEVKEASDETRVFGDVLKASLASEAIIAGVKALGSAMKSIADYAVSAASYADDIMTLSDVTGITTDALQEFKYMEELVDVSLDTMTSSMTRQIRSMKAAQDGTKLTAEAYEKLNIQITNADGTLRNGQEVYWEIIDALAKMTNETERDAIAMQLMGRSARDLMPLMSAGSAGIAEFAAEARNAGAVLSDKTLQELGKTDDALQRLYQSTDIAKRKFGIEMAPALEQAATKITRRVSEMDDSFARFAGGALNFAADGLLFIMDNADTVAAGLGGIAAGFAAFKAAQTISVAVTAIKTLTTATKTATTATHALTAAQMATPWGLLAAAVGGTVAALLIYNATTEKAKTATDLVVESAKEGISAAKALSKAILENAEAYDERINALEIESGASARLAEELYNLADKTERTADEKTEMLTLVGQLNRAIPELALSIDDETGSLSLQREEVEKLINANSRLAKVKAAGDRLSEIPKEQIAIENELIKLEAQRVEMLNEYSMLGKTVDEITGTMSTKISTKVFKTYTQLVGQIERLKNNNDELGREWERLNDVISDTSGLTKAQKAYEALETALSKTALEDYAAKEKDLENEITRSRQKLADDLDDFLYDERQKFKNAQKAKVKEVEQAASDELSVLESAHKRKLALIDDEYTERIKLIDEELYNKNKAIQDEIDHVEQTAAAEKAAERDKQNQEKLQSLQTAATSARTTADRERAQKELAEFEKQLVAEKLEAERNAQLASLKQRQDQVKKEHALTVKALSDEQKAKTTAANEEYEAEKKAANDHYALIKANLERVQELESRDEERRLRDIRRNWEEQDAAKIEGIKATNAKTLEEHKKNADKVIADALRASKEYLDLIKESGEDIYDESKEIGRLTSQGFIDGMKDPEAAKEIGYYFGTPIDLAKKALDIRSPSHKFEEIGEQTIEGYIAGLNKRISSVNETMRKVLTPTDAGASIVEGVVNGVNTALSAQPRFGQGGEIGAAPIYLDGREIARAIFKYLDDEGRRIGT